MAEEENIVYDFIKCLANKVFKRGLKNADFLNKS